MSHGGFGAVVLWRLRGYAVAMSEETTSMRCPIEARDRLNRTARELGLSTAELLRILQYVTTGEIVVMARRRGAAEAAAGRVGEVDAGGDG